MIRFTGEIDGIPAFDRAFNRIEQHIADIRSFAPGIAGEFYAIEEGQFGSEGAKGASGKWAPLSPAYKQWKATHFPGEPILKLMHPLYESLTSPDAADSIYRVSGNEIAIGSRTPYAVAHQRGTGFMPARPPISMTAADKRRIQKAIQAELVRFTRRLGFEVQDKAA